MCVQLKAWQPLKSVAVSNGWWGRRAPAVAGSLSPSCFAKKKVVQGWPVTLFCLAVDIKYFSIRSRRGCSIKDAEAG